MKIKNLRIALKVGMVQKHKEYKRGQLDFFNILRTNTTTQEGSICYCGKQSKCKCGNPNMNQFLSFLNLQDPTPPNTNPSTEVVVCNVCNSQMILRTNKVNGSKFWGCSKYPTCTNTKKMTISYGD